MLVGEQAEEGLLLGGVELDRRPGGERVEDGLRAPLDGVQGHRARRPRVVEV